jgi:hypothetical protein
VTLSCGWRIDEMAPAEAVTLPEFQKKVPMKERRQ